MLSVLCGVLPLPPPLVWQCPSSAVTGETGCSLASPQKSGELNKPPGKHKISFTLCSWATPKEVLLPPPQKRTGSCFTKPLWLPANLPFQLLDLTIFLFLRLHRCPLIQPPPFLFCFGLCKRLVFIARLSAAVALCSLLAPSVSFSYCSAICVSAFLSC